MGTNARIAYHSVCPPTSLHPRNGEGVGAVARHIGVGKMRLERRLDFACRPSGTHTEDERSVLTKFRRARYAKNLIGAPANA